MSKELMRRSSGALGTRDEVGGGMMKVSLAGLGLYGVAWLLPISLPVIFVLLFVAGFLVAKGDD